MFDLADSNLSELVWGGSNIWGRQEIALPFPMGSMRLERHREICQGLDCGSNGRPTSRVSSPQPMFTRIKNCFFRFPLRCVYLT